MIKKYFGSDWSTLIGELKKGDKITFIIKGSTAYVEGSNLCVSCIGNDSNQRQIVYQLQKEAPNRQNPKKKPTNHAGLSNAQMKSLEKELKRTGVGMDAVKERYQISEPERMSEETYQRVMAALSKTEPAA